MRNKIAAVLLTLSMLTGSSAPVSAGEELIWSGTDQVDAIVTENRVDSSRDITEETFRYEMDDETLGRKLTSDYNVIAISDKEER